MNETGLTILVIEDMMEMQVEITERLNKSGLPISEIFYAQNRHDGCNEATAHKPDVILYDLGLPDSTPDEGLATFRQITNRFPVVVLSGQHESTWWRPCIQAGAMDYLSKIAFLAPGAEAFLGHAILNAFLRFRAE